MSIRRIWQSESQKPYIIAEVSQNHDGSLGQAHAFIDAVAEAGADAIKFQTHIAEEESTIFEPFRVQFSYEDATRYDYWKRMEFTKEQWKELANHAEEKGLDFLSSPFSVEALELLNEIGVCAWKLGAGEVFNEILLSRAIETGKPILLSTGLSTFSDIDKWVEKIRENGNELLLFQCVTAYPATAEMIDISQIIQLRERYNCKVGISDHSATIYPAIAGCALGASAVEVHVTLSKYMFGPDVKASVDIKQLKQIVEGSRFVHTMLNSQHSMYDRTQQQEELKRIFSKSPYAVDEIQAGTVITMDLFKMKKPNSGMGFNELRDNLGKKVKRTIPAGSPLRIEDLE